jgi:predicted dehydrogenase
MVEDRGPVIQAVATFYKYNPRPRYYGGTVDFLHCDAVHAVDLLRHLAGEPKRVAAVAGRYGDVEPNAYGAVIDFEGGAIGVLLTNWAVGRRVHTVEIHGVGASALVDPELEIRFSAEDARYGVRADEAGEVITAAELTSTDDFRVVYGFAAENRHFVECVLSDTEPVANFADAAKTMELCDRIEAAGASGEMR